jgi:transcriptional regulator with XRE-family HTH domain
MVLPEQRCAQVSEVIPVVRDGAAPVASTVPASVKLNTSAGEARAITMAPVAGHEKRDERAQRQASQMLTDMGREIRIARLGHDLSQATAGRAIGYSKSTWSRIERGQAPGFPVVELARALAVVGLDLHIRTYPGGQPLRDVAHLQLLERLRMRLGAGDALADRGSDAPGQRPACLGRCRCGT